MADAATEADRLSGIHPPRRKPVEIQCVTVTFGPRGPEIDHDYTDARYWVRQINFVRDAAGVPQSLAQLGPPLGALYATSTNLSEVDAGTHGLPPNTFVLVREIRDSGGVPAFVFDVPGLPTGACCMPPGEEGGCVENKSEAACTADGGEWAGANTTCDPDPCTGACCLGANNATCLPNQTQADCDAEGGIFVGVGTDCQPNPCDTTPGACCFGESCVAGQTQAECQSEGGVWKGPGTDCEPNPCLDPDPEPGGACCVGETCHPNETEQGCCLLGGDWQGPNATCFPNPCGETEGSCCTGPNFNTCVPNVTKGQCCVFNGGTGHWNGPGSSCGPPDPCTMEPTRGACCFGPPPPPDQSCVPNQTQLECQSEGGTWYPGQDCTPSECQGQPPTTGACCEPGPLPQTCHEDWTAVQCTAIDGSWFPDQPCTPPECESEEPPTMGACCFGSFNPDQQCSDLDTQQACIDIDGNWHGFGSTCDPLPADCVGQAETTGACCEIGAGGPCFPDLTVDECDKQCPQCNWFPDVPCTPVQCPGEPQTTGACCPPDGPCIPDIDEETCQKFNQGIWLGIGSDCGPPDPCPGACCIPPFPKVCDVRSATDCDSVDGDWLGFGTDCGPPDPCVSDQILGICCCFGDCSVVTESECLGINAACTWTGLTDPNNLTPCTPNPCPCPGACCVGGSILPGPNSAPRTCVMRNSEAACVHDNGEWLGCGSICSSLDPDQCNGTGACCIGQSCIDDQTQIECRAEGGVFLGVGTTCANDPCPGEPLGKCCLPDGTCVDLPEQECIDLDGMWLGGTTCAQSPNCTGEAFDCCLDDPFMPGFCLCQSVGTCSECTTLGGTCHLLGWCAEQSPGDPSTCCHACCTPSIGCEEGCTMTIGSECSAPNQTFHPQGSCFPQASSPCDICCYCADGGPNCKEPGICPGQDGPPCYRCASVLECVSLGCVQIMNTCCIS